MTEERFDIDVSYRDPLEPCDEEPYWPPSPSEYEDPPQRGGFMKLEIELSEVYDGHPEDGPTSIEDRIIETAAWKLIELYGGKDTLALRAEALVKESLREQVQTHAGDVIREALEQPIQRTGQYGSPEGEPKPLREWIAGEIKNQITLRDGRYSQDSSTLTKFIREEVENKLRGELSKELAAAKKQVVDRLNAKAVETVTEAMKKTLPF